MSPRTLLKFALVATVTALGSAVSPTKTRFSAMATRTEMVLSTWSMRSLSPTSFPEAARRSLPCVAAADRTSTASSTPWRSLASGTGPRV